MVSQGHDNNDHFHDHNHHEHHEFEEYVFTTHKKLDIKKFQEWVLYKFPDNVVRSKGFIRFDNQYYPTFLFQMVGAKKILTPFKPTREVIDAKISRLVFIGKNIDKKQIEEDLRSFAI